MVAHVAFILLFTSSDMLFTKSKLAIWLELPQLLGMPCAVSDHIAILKKTHVLSVFAKTLFAHPISHGSVLITLLPFASLRKTLLHSCDDQRMLQC